ncbi:MAG TPA: metal ABC transporter ATP-binding protein [Polyangiaceae bacterium]|nr:metal ABC transporter ATP-binding protein [Polyangiaceae bacterium]
MVTAQDSATDDSAPERDALVECARLEVGHAGRAILPAIDLSIRRGEFWAVIGRNGSGKTTWLRTVLGLAPPIRGSVLRAAGLRVSYLPQRSTLDELYPLLAREVVAMGAERAWSFLGLAKHGRTEQVQQALAEMGVADLRERPFRQLSEGQKQRVLFARIAASHAELTILDEPTSAMDVIAEREAFELLDELRKRQNLAIVVVSHYLGLARSFADRAVLLDRDAKAVIVGSCEDVFSNQVFRDRYAGSLATERHAKLD